MTTEYKCFEILHDGEGPLGRSVESLGVSSPEAAAASAADYFDDVEQLNERWEDSDFDGCDRPIEVQTLGGDVVGRYRVFCEVKRHYKSIDLERSGL